MQSNMYNSNPSRLISGLSARSNLAKTYGQKLMQTVLDQNLVRRTSSSRPSINRRFSSVSRFMKEFQSRRISNSSKRRSNLKANINYGRRGMGSYVQSFKFSNVTSALYQDSENDSEQ